MPAPSQTYNLCKGVEYQVINPIKINREYGKIYATKGKTRQTEEKKNSFEGKEIQ
jgi:hypothetical protein